PEEAAAYQRLSSQLAGLLARREQLLFVFHPESSPVRTTQSQIEETKEAISALGYDPTTITAQSGTQQNVFDHNSARERLLDLQTKVAVYQKQLEQVLLQAQKVDSVESTILVLERKREVDDEK